MQRTADEFERAHRERGISQWDSHACSLCGVVVGWRFYEGGLVTYAAACGCSWEPERRSSWEEVADRYNRNQPERNDRISPEQVAEMDAFWGFPPAPVLQEER